MPHSGLVRESLNEHGVPGELVVIPDGDSAIRFIESLDAKTTACPDLVMRLRSIKEENMGQRFIWIVGIAAFLTCPPFCTAEATARVGSRRSPPIARADGAAATNITRQKSARRKRRSVV